MVQQYQRYRVMKSKSYELYFSSSDSGPFERFDL
jgi:hypothetical protein